MEKGGTWTSFRPLLLGLPCLQSHAERLTKPVASRNLGCESSGRTVLHSCGKQMLWGLQQVHFLEVMQQQVFCNPAYSCSAIYSINFPLDCISEATERYTDVTLRSSLLKLIHKSASHGTAHHRWISLLFCMITALMRQILATWELTRNYNCEHLDAPMAVNFLRFAAASRRGEAIALSKNFLLSAMSGSETWP